MHKRPTIDLQTPTATQAALRVFFRISTAWQLDPAEEAALLGESPELVDAWRTQPPHEPLTPITLERLSYVFGIYASLAELFQNSGRAHAWVRRPNTAPLFEGETALTLMLNDDVGGLRAVRAYLEAQCDY